MFTQSITASNFVLSRQSTSSVANKAATAHVVRQVDIASPKVSVRTFFSMPNLFQLIKALDSSFGRALGVAIELPVHCAPDWRRLSRTTGLGGQLSVVIPPQSRITLPMLASRGEQLPIGGWELAQRCLTIDQAIEAMLLAKPTLRRCFILHPEWLDPTRIYSAIGRNIAS